jgi:hypothetical protein
MSRVKSKKAEGGNSKKRTVKAAHIRGAPEGVRRRIF